MSSDASQSEPAIAVPTNGATGGLQTWLLQAWGFTARTVGSLRRNYTMLLLVVGFPVIFYVVFTTSGSPSPGVRAAIAVTWCMFGALLGSMYVFGNQLAVDVEDNRYVTYRSMPIYPSAEFAGRVIGGILVGAIAIVPAVIVGVIDGASFVIRSPLSVVVVPLAFALVCTLLMMLTLPVVIVLKNERYVESATSLLVVFLFFITGQNGATPELAWVDSFWLNYIPNSLATRLAAYHSVPADAWAAAGFTEPAMPEGLEFVAITGVYGLLAVTTGVVIWRRVLYKLEVIP